MFTMLAMAMSEMQNESILVDLQLLLAQLVVAMLLPDRCSDVIVFGQSMRLAYQ
jgi:hypothetical protein